MRQENGPEVRSRDVFQQGALLLILAVYEYEEKPPVTFAGYLKKRIDWGLWSYYRKELKRNAEVNMGLNIKGEKK